MKDFGLFIGKTALTSYANNSINPMDFENKIINRTFSEFKIDLNNKLKNNTKLDESLYNPINFYAFGSFNLITLSLIDDFHFGNFSFRPNNKYLNEKDGNNSNFQYQVVNNYNLVTNKDFYLSDLNQERFICICKLKINSIILIGNTIDNVRFIKNYLNEIFENNSLKIIIGESLSWHELTLTVSGNSISEIFNLIIELRKLTIEKINLKICEKNLLQKYNINVDENLIHLFTDTESTYGKNMNFFNEESYINDYLNSSCDNNIRVSTKLQLKTGHEIELKSLIKNKFNDCVETINYTNGRSDIGLKYKDRSLKSYMIFWNKLHKKKKLMSHFFNHVRKIHTNIIFNDENTLCDIEPTSNKMYSKLFNKIKFKHKSIIQIEKNLSKLNISKEISNKVLTLYTNFNEIICDVNLFLYYIDMKGILNDIESIINEIAIETNQNRKTVTVTKILLNYIEAFEKAYQNRFFESKRFGYNLDIKGDFNGGVHQIIHSFDSIFKIVSQKLSIDKDDKHIHPIATFGSSIFGIKSNIINLNINYFQLFQPEFFLFSVIKEKLNFSMDRISFSEVSSKYYNSESESKTNVDEERRLISKIIHETPNLRLKKLLFDYLPPQFLKKKLSYITTYSIFISEFWKQNIDLFIFWFWHIFLQNSSLYNCDGTIRIDVLKETYFGFYIAYRINKGYEPNIEIIKEMVRAKDLHYLIFDSQSNIHEECKEVYEELFINKKTNLITIISMYSEIIRLTSNDNINEEISKLYSQIKQFTLLKLEEIKKTIINNDGVTSCYIRMNDYPKNIYCDSIFDSHGGIFTILPEKRIEIFKIRLSIIDELRSISYRYSYNLF